ncbi:hypothetical protein [Streptomyces griseorubiginosus]|uniref:hypothetical protein n=1 Tax=Streptomyces griseorubiginosus TaxID=67304 RepID=UPI0036E68E6A
MTAIPIQLAPAASESLDLPGPDTLVLLNREVRPDADLARLSRFADDRWDLSPGVFEATAKTHGLNFTLIPARLRPAARHYFWQLLNFTGARVVKHSTPERPAVRSVALAFASFRHFMTWLDSQGVGAFPDISEELLDRYLASFTDDEVDLARQYRLVGEVRRLWFYRHTMPSAMRMPDAPPWDGEESSVLLGKVKPQRENRRKRIPELTMQQLLMWSLRLVEDFADDIITAHGECLKLHMTDPRYRREHGLPPRSRIPRSADRKLAAYLEELRATGGALPGITNPDGTRRIHWMHVGRILDSYGTFDTTDHTRHEAAAKGVPIDDDAYLRAPVTGQLDGRPWREQPVRFREARDLARHLSTACFIVIAYLSGGRPGELLNLERGCVTHQPDTGLWLLQGKFFKNAVDVNGNKIPDGLVRRDPWVVIEAVADAVAVLERLHPHQLLFPVWLEQGRQDRRGTKRPGQARTDDTLTLDIKRFITWVNQQCQARGRNDGIPTEGLGSPTSSRFRRTLAWFIRRRPRGLVAAAIQYGHLHTRMLQGYAGTYESGFPDECAFEDWLYRVEILAEDEEALRNGEHVSGPAADAYRQRVNAATRQFAGHVLTSERQAHDLLGNPLLQIFHGQGMTCVLDPAQAACQLQGTADDPVVTPDIDDCRPRCRNIARTDRDIEHVRAQRDDLQKVTADQLAPPIRYARERHELQRLDRIVNEHERDTHK